MLMNESSIPSASCRFWSSAWGAGRGREAGEAGESGSGGLGFRV